MADVRIAVEQVDRAGNGLTATYTGGLSVANTYLVNNDGRVVLHFKKTGAGACTVTVTTPGTVDGLAVADLTASVPATTGDIFLGPFPTDQYNAAGEQDIRFTLSEITGLTVAVLRV